MIIRVDSMRGKPIARLEAGEITPTTEWVVVEWDLKVQHTTRTFTTYGRSMKLKLLRSVSYGPHVRISAETERKLRRGKVLLPYEEESGKVDKL